MYLRQKTQMQRIHMIPADGLFDLMIHMLNSRKILWIILLKQQKTCVLWVKTTTHMCSILIILKILVGFSLQKTLKSNTIKSKMHSKMLQAEDIRIPIHHFSLFLVRKSVITEWMFTINGWTYLNVNQLQSWLVWVLSLCSTVLPQCFKNTNKACKRV